MAVLLGLSVTLACADLRTSSEGGRTPEPFRGSAASLEELGEEVLEALARGDVAALEAFRLSELEHNEVVWPELPAAAPEIAFPVDMAWTNIEARNHSALVRITPRYDGRDVTFRAAVCRGETERFRTFVVLTDCWVSFDMDMRRMEVLLFKDVLLRGGGYKIFRYYDDDPRARRSAAAEEGPLHGAPPMTPRGTADMFVPSSSSTAVR